MSYDLKKTTNTGKNKKSAGDNICKSNDAHYCDFAGDNICKSNDAHYCDTEKKTKAYQKGGKFAKITKIVFMKTGCSKKKDHSRKIKPL